MGWRESDYARPIVAVVNPWNELNTCHTHFPERVQDIKLGVLAAGGTPVEIPVMSLGEQLMKPSAMMYRNFSGARSRGGFARLSGRWRGFVGRLRQDDAGRFDGRDFDESAVRVCAGGGDDAGAFSGRERSAAARMCGSIGTSGAPGGCRNANGARSKTASRARPAFA